MQTPADARPTPAGIGESLRRNAAQRSTIDQVITLFAPAGGTTRASLTFRVGTSDEALPLRGINHLIGHLAAVSAGRDPSDCPVTVSASTTTFHITGNALAVANELGAICHWIGTAASGVLDDRVLSIARAAAQADGAPHAPEHATLLRHRFGASGWGSAAFAEFGLGRLDGSTLADWLRRYFTRGNAVLALSGTKATTLRLPLPEGELVPMIAVPESVHPLPGLVAVDSPTLSIGGAIPTDPRQLDRDRAHAGLSCEIMRSRSAYAARKRFDELKLKGSPMSIGDSVVHCALTGTVGADDEAKVLDIVLESLDVLRSRQLVAGELRAHVNRRLAAYDRAVAQPAGAHELMHRQAVGALLEHPWSLALERRLVGKADEGLINEQLAAACTSLLVRAADQHPPVRPWPSAPPATGFSPAGTPWLSVPAYGRDPQAPPRRLTIDDTGVSVLVLRGRAAAPQQRQLAWSDLRIAQAWDDGRYLLTPEHGPALEVRPEHWANPEGVGAELAAHIPADITVPMGERDTPTPAKPRPTDRVTPVAWLGAALLALLVIVCAALPIWPSSIDIARWVLGGLGLLVLGVGAWQYAEVRTTERRFQRPP